jgi:galactonate dehydratase
MAEAYYAAIAPRNPMGAISLACGLHLAASIPNFLCEEQVSLGDGYLKNPFKVKNGYIDIPTGPGLGVELDEEAMADKIGHDWRNPESYHVDDGSVVDWWGRCQVRGVRSQGKRGTPNSEWQIVNHEL